MERWSGGVVERSMGVQGDRVGRGVVGLQSAGAGLPMFRRCRLRAGRARYLHATRPAGRTGTRAPGTRPSLVPHSRVQFCQSGRTVGMRWTVGVIVISRIGHGRGPGGQWSMFIRAWSASRQDRQRVKVPTAYSPPVDPVTMYRWSTTHLRIAAQMKTVKHDSASGDQDHGSTTKTECFGHDGNRTGRRWTEGQHPPCLDQDSTMKHEPATVFR